MAENAPAKGAQRGGNRQHGDHCPEFVDRTEKGFGV
jgi:hypothetical protein